MKKGRTAKILMNYLICFLILGISISCGNSVKKQGENIPIHNIQKNSAITKWLVLGPFPNPEVDEPMPDGSYLYGYYTDFLAQVGGETTTKIPATVNLNYKDKNYNVQNIKPIPVTARKNNIVDLKSLFKGTNYQTAYAYCYIFSNKPQTAYFFLGSDDGVKVWINGKLEHALNVGRAVTPDEDFFKADLQKGLNFVLVKITNYVREWGFIVKVLDEEGYELYREKIREKKALNDFLNTTLVPINADPWNNFFTPGEFPTLDWEDPYLTEKVMDKFSFKVRWFNNRLEEVKKAEKPGRYAFYVEGKTKDGRIIRRAKTMYCMPENWLAWGERLKANLEFFPVNFIDKNAMMKQKEPIGEFVGRLLLLSILKQEEGAKLISYLDEIGPNDPLKDFTMNPLIRDEEFHLAIKRKILGIEGKWRPLKLPITRREPAPVLRQGTEETAGVKKGTRAALRKVCQEWYKESGEPFVILIARKGVIILHEAFGDRPDGPVTLNTASEIASISKLITGVMFAQFVDQGLIDIDDPVGKFLPDFPVKGEKAITLRHCFTHTCGLSGHEEWGGVHNPWLDNIIANQLPVIEVGKRHEYNGMGYDLAGKVMEIVSGKSIFRLLKENFFDPLGLKHTVMEEDLAFSCHTTAKELAIFGQLMLNKGSYGDKQFFSEVTFERLLPKPLNQYYPEIRDISWGIGITEMTQKHPLAGKNGNPEDLTILSKNMFGHGSATSAILRIDPDNGLVISQTRRRGGPYYEKYLEKLLLTLENGLKEIKK